MNDEIKISAGQTVAEIADECGVDAGVLLDYIAEGIEENKMSGLSALGKALS
jgi:hypothetical protein